MKEKFYYRDFVTRKIRWTYGKPIAISRGGPINAWGLIFENRCSHVWIPEYLLVGNSKQIFKSMKNDPIWVITPC